VAPERPDNRILRGTDTRKTLIYVLRRGDSREVKIGITRDLARRVKAIQHANAQPITVFATFPGDPFAERRVHERFARARVRGEWFAADDGLLAWATAQNGKPLPSGIRWHLMGASQ
jgi:hypothetical protein